MQEYVLIYPQLICKYMQNVCRYLQYMSIYTIENIKNFAKKNMPKKYYANYVGLKFIGYLHSVLYSFRRRRAGRTGMPGPSGAAGVMVVPVTSSGPRTTRIGPPRARSAGPGQGPVRASAALPVSGSRTVTFKVNRDLTHRRDSGRWQPGSGTPSAAARLRVPLPKCRVSLSQA